MLMDVDGQLDGKLCTSESRHWATRLNLSRFARSRVRRANAFAWGAQQQVLFLPSSRVPV